MPSYPTPRPITAAVELTAGTIQVAADDVAETTVEVRPSDPSRRADVEAVEATRVEFAGDRLLVKATERWKSWSPFGYGGSVDVELRLPAGSAITASTSLGAVRVTGAAGELRVKTTGDIDVAHAESARLTTSLGDITLDRVAGELEVATASGDVRIGRADARAQVKTASGDTRIGTAAAVLRASAASGDILIEHAAGPVAVKSGKGDLRIGAAAGQSVSAVTGYGEIEIEVAPGRAAWLDLQTGYGQVRNGLDAGGPPEPGEPVVQVHARSGYGDITVRRATSPDEPRALEAAR